MRARHRFNHGIHLEPVQRLENAGFGSTLAVMAIAVFGGFGAPVVREGGEIAQWLDNCMTIARAIASTAASLFA